MRSFVCLILLIGFVAGVTADDYPTLERVDHVMTCMRLNGGQTVDNLYACACEIDMIAQRMPVEDFIEARTYEVYKRMPGEAGGMFRDSERGEEIVGVLDAARAEAKKRCFIGVRKKQEKTTAKPSN